MLRSNLPAAAIAALSPVATRMAPLRYAQALALARADRDEEAIQILEALREAVDDPRVEILRGLVMAKQGKADAAADVLRAALE